MITSADTAPMQRDLKQLTRQRFDVVIVGGGIYGICAAWDAALRGLSVALVERGDFCAATSANPLKIMHGGFRYLQHADIRRIRHSSRERNVMMRIAPHLAYPLPFLIPTYGRGIQGKELLTVALSVYNLLVPDRNRGIRDPALRIPWGGLVSRRACLERFPDLSRQRLTGAVVFYDGQLYSPPRVAMCYLRSAVDAGAQAANYIEVTKLLRRGNRVTGVAARDVLSGDELQIEGRLVLNCCGPWLQEVLSQAGIALPRPLEVTKDIFLVVNRVVDPQYALAVPCSERDSTALISRGRRHYFFIPWRGHTLIGSTHIPYEGRADDCRVAEEDIQALLDEINAAYPIGLKRHEVTMCNWGLVLFGPYYGKHSRIVDHGRQHGVRGLVSVAGVRFTTARGVAERTIDLVARKLGRRVPPSATAHTPIYGGRIECFDAFCRQAIERHAARIDEPAMRSLLRNHGSQYRSVLSCAEGDLSLLEPVAGTTVLKAAVVHAVRQEMAVKLADVVLRRTEMGTAGHPGDEALQDCAAVMAAQLGWNSARVQAELEEVRRAFP